MRRPVTSITLNPPSSMSRKYMVSFLTSSAHMQRYGKHLAAARGSWVKISESLIEGFAAYGELKPQASPI